MIEIKDNLNKLKEYASNRQAFLGLKHFENEISIKVKFINELLQNGDLKQTFLTWKLNPVLKSFATLIKDFGSIEVVSKPCQEPIVWKKSD